MRRSVVHVLAIAAAGIAIIALLGRTRTPELPAGIAKANGRIEVERVDIATKPAGRIAGSQPLYVRAPGRGRSLRDRGRVVELPLTVVSPMPLMCLFYGGTDRPAQSNT